MTCKKPYLLVLNTAGIAVAATLIASPALAQQEEPTSRYAIEEITVSARRVEEGLQRAPIAVTAISGIELENRGAINVIDFADIAPNVSFKADGVTSGFAAAPRISIRGIGQSDFVINTDPAVGIYADGVYLGRSLGSILDLIDVERVEALRGPQGTLFGRNSTGGAINVIAKKPEVGVPASGYVTASVGEVGFTLLRGGANFPIGDNSAVRVTALKRERDGFIPLFNYDGVELGAEDVTGLRAAFRWQPNDSMTLDIDADFSNRDDTPAPVIPVTVGDSSGGETNLDISGAGPQQPGFSTSVFARRFNGEPFTPPIPPDFGALGFISGDPQCATDAAYRNSSRTCLGNAWVASRDGSYQAWFDGEGNLVRPRQELETYGYSARFSWETDAFTFKSISSWRGFDSSFTNGSPTATFIATNENQRFDQDQFSQEFNFNGDFSDRVSWLAGVFYQEEDGTEIVQTVFPLAPPAGNNDRDFLPIAGSEDRNIDNTSKAIFGQLSFNITDDLELTVGARRTEEEKGVLINKIENTAGVISTVLTGDVDIKESSFLANLSWQATDDIMLYGQFSDGFRNGGFPARTPPGTSVPFESVIYDPEFVETLEFGLKATALDNRLRANFAIFSSDYTDQQINAGVFDPVTLGTTATVANVGDSDISGFELEANYLVNDNFRIDTSIGYLDAELTSVNTPNGEFVLNDGTNLRRVITSDSNAVLPYAPEWQVNLGANYSFYMANGAEIRNRIDVFYESEQFSNIANYNLNRIPSTTRLNYFITYIPNAPWELSLGIRNLTDEEDILNTSVNTGPGVGIYHVLSRGREAFLQFTYSFGDE